MYVITANELICEITAEIEQRPFGIFIKDKNYIIGHEASVYEVVVIPEGVAPSTHCYTPEKGFYLYVPPKTEPKPPTPEERIEALEQEKLALQIALAETIEKQEIDTINNQLALAELVETLTMKGVL